MSNKKPAPTIAIIDLCDNTIVKRVVNTLQITSNEISLKETPATKAKPALRPLVKLCFKIAKIMGPIEILKISPSKRPFKMGAIMLVV